MSLTEGYDTLLNQLVEMYPNRVAASALVYDYGTEAADDFGVRVEAPSIALEFLSNVNLGKDPTGDLFFDSVDELSGKTRGKPNCAYNLQITSSSVSPDQRAFIISFYRTIPEESFAKFLARDRSGQVAKERKAYGKWLDLKVCNVSMRVTKLGHEKFWTLSIPSLDNKIGKFTQPEGTTVHDHVDIWGTLAFKMLEDIDLGTWVDYRNDRLVFTKTQKDDRDFCAYFIPPEVKDNLKPLGDYKFSNNTVSWPNM